MILYDIILCYISLYIIIFPYTCLFLSFTSALHLRSFKIVRKSATIVLKTDLKHFFVKQMTISEGLETHNVFRDRKNGQMSKL